MSNTTILSVQLSPDLKRGMATMGFFASVSILATFACALFFIHRLVTMKATNPQDIRKNTPLLLLINLLVADLFQALTFVISLYWLTKGAILPNHVCCLQGFFLNFGDMASGFFIMAIALGTWWNLWMERCIPYGKMQIFILSLWILALSLSVLGPLTLDNYYIPLNAWCWANPEYKRERLLYHYTWLFMVEFGVVIIYGCVFIHLRRVRQQVCQASDANPLQCAAISPRQISRFCRYMVMYPVAYIILTLPLAAGRMISITRPTLLPNWYWILAGSFITSSGWIDTAMYACTRKKTFQVTIDYEVHQTRSLTSSTYHIRSNTVLSLTSNYLHGAIAGTERYPLSPQEPDSPYSHPNDTDGTLNTTTHLVRPPSTPSPSIYSANRQQNSSFTYLSAQLPSRLALTLVTDLGAGYPSYGNPSPSPVIDLDDLPPATQKETR